MKIAVLGSSGQLGFDLVRELPGRGHEVMGLSGRRELDVLDSGAFERFLDEKAPHAVVNTASYHQVDLCEREVDLAYRTNVIAVREMAKACEKRGVKFVQIGTDYVVEGWPACKPVGEDKPVSPNSIYSLTRYGGDCMALAHAPTCGYAVRVCGLFGVAGCKLKNGFNFVDLMVKMAREKKPMKVVDDQVLSPTPTDQLAKQLAIILEESGTGGKLAPGLYHAVSHGETSWYNFAATALKLAGIDHPIEPVSTAAFAAAAKRPRYSVLDNAKLRAVNLDVMEPWQVGLERYVRIKYG